MSSQIRQKFPFEFESLYPEETAEIKNNYNGILSLMSGATAFFEFARVGPKGYILSADYQGDAENIYNLCLTSDDVIVTSFPRSGTTWTQELVWLIIKDLDYETARSVPLTQRYTFIEFPSLFTIKSIESLIELNKFKEIHTDAEFLKSSIKPSSEILASRPSPRFIKTHLPLSFLPPTAIDMARVVYVARDPRDVAVSCYHFNKMTSFINHEAEFRTHWDLFRKNVVLWGPYFEHLKEAWARRNHPNMLFLFYEELSDDLPKIVRRVADFFGKQLPEEQVAGLCEHLSIENFKKNDSVNIKTMYGLAYYNEFIRTGKTGGWREYFDEEMTQEAERWIADNLRDTDLRFPHMN